MVTEMQNKFWTLLDALESENLLCSWDRSYRQIDPGETRQYTWQNRLITITRLDDGMYEKPIYCSF